MCVNLRIEIIVFTCVNQGFKKLGYESVLFFSLLWFIRVNIFQDFDLGFKILMTHASRFLGWDILDVRHTIRDQQLHAAIKWSLDNRDVYYYMYY